MSATESPEEDYPVFTRASGTLLCPVCGKEYWRHPHEMKWLDWMGAGYLRKLCDGKLVKP